MAAAPRAFVTAASAIVANLVATLRCLYSFRKIPLGTIRSSGRTFAHKLLDMNGELQTALTGEDAYYCQHSGEMFPESFVNVVAVGLALTTNSVFCDLGSASGLLVLLAASLGLVKAIGVELSRGLHDDGQRALMAAKDRRLDWAERVELYNDNFLHQPECDLTRNLCLYILSYMHCVEKLALMKPLEECGRGTCDGSRRSCIGFCKVFVPAGTDEVLTDWHTRPITMYFYTVVTGNIGESLSRELLLFQANRRQPVVVPKRGKTPKRRREHELNPDGAAHQCAVLELVDSKSGANGNGVAFTDLSIESAKTLTRIGSTEFLASLMYPGDAVGFTTQSHKSAYAYHLRLFSMTLQLFSIPKLRMGDLPPTVLQAQPVVSFKFDRDLVDRCKGELQHLWDEPVLQRYVPRHITAGPQLKKIDPCMNRCFLNSEDLEAALRHLPATRRLIDELLDKWKLTFGYELLPHALFASIKTDRKGSFGDVHKDYPDERRNCSIVVLIGVFEQEQIVPQDRVRVADVQPAEMGCGIRDIQVVPTCCRTPTYPTMRAHTHASSRTHARTHAPSHLSGSCSHRSWSRGRSCP